MLIPFIMQLSLDRRLSFAKHFVLAQREAGEPFTLFNDDIDAGAISMTSVLVGQMGRFGLHPPSYPIKIFRQSES